MSATCRWGFQREYMPATCRWGLDVMYKPRSSVCVTWISPGLIINAGHAFGLKQEVHHRWTRDRSLVNWEKFVHCQVRANETNSEAKRQFCYRNKAVLMNVQSPHKWWSTLNPSYLGLGYVTPTKHLMPNFMSLVSLIQVSIKQSFNRYTINSSAH